MIDKLHIALYTNNMTLSEFIKQLQQIESEINRNAHQAISDSLRFYIDLPDDLVGLKLREIEVDQALGCGCWLGAVIMLSLDDTEYELCKK